MYIIFIVLNILVIANITSYSNKWKQDKLLTYYYKNYYIVEKFLYDLVNIRVIQKLYCNDLKRKKKFWKRNRSISDEIIISDKDFSFNYYRGYSFTNITFENCKFARCIFEDCEFSRIKFKNCEFGETTKYKKESKAILMSKEFDTLPSSSIFKNCEFIGIKFCDKTSLRYSVFNKCSFFPITEFNNTNMAFSNLIECEFFHLDINNSNLNGARVLKPKLCGFTLLLDSQIKGSSFNELTYIDKFEVKSGFKDSALLSISSFYFQIANICYNSNIMKNYSKYYYLSRYYSKQTEIEMFGKAKQYLNDFICGFGEKPYRIIRFGAICILFFAIVYMFTGLVMPGDKLPTYYSLDTTYLKKLFSTTNPFIAFYKLLWHYVPAQQLRDFLYCIYFSIVTFTTVGYGDITPVGLSRFFANLEMLSGITIAGLWTAILARKMMR